MKLTEEEALNYHVQMWNEMAENGYRFKAQSDIAIKYNACHYCFFCEYYRFTKEAGDCTDCPFIKFDDTESDDYGVCPCLDIEKSPYYKYDKICEYGDLAEIKNLCIEIAELGLI